MRARGFRRAARGVIPTGEGILPATAHAAARAIPDIAGDSASLPSSPLRLRFWGVRGSHPYVRNNGSSVGGNTTCLELRCGRHVVVFDAGSGCIPLGEALAGEWRDMPAMGRPALTLLFTHAHHDHLCGLPFFAPLYQPDAELRLFGPDLAGLRFEEIVAGYMRSPYFPVDFRDLPSRRQLTSIGDGARLVWPADGSPPALGRPGQPAPEGALVVDVMHSTLHPREGTLLYRATFAGRSVVFATDVEVREPGSAAEQRFIRFARGADVLIHDAQYSEEDYGAAPRRGFGHSTPAMAARVAKAAGVGRLILFHHDPDYADAEVLSQREAARAIFARSETAREGVEICMDGGEEPVV